MKTRHKITLFFALLVTIILLMVSLSVYYFSSLERQELFKKRLKGRASNNAQIFSYDNEKSKTFLDRINVSSLLLPERTVEIYNLQAKLVYRYQNDSLNNTGATKETISLAIRNGEYFYAMGSRESLAVYFPEDGEGIVIVVAAYDSDGWAQLRQLRHIFMLSMLFGTVVSLLAGHVFSKELLKPVAHMIREVNEISSHNLSNRLRTGDRQDELNMLSGTFNELLDRLQEYFIAQRRFISNASHELSTPLTSISSQLEVTLQRDRATDEYRQVMLSVQEDVVQMSQLTKSLLEIARTGSEGSIELNEVRIDEILFKVMADIRKINPEYEVELNFDDSTEQDNNFLVFGNADLLYISVKNLVENGCKYSPDHTSRVHLSFDEDSAIISVKNLGERIQEDDLEKIFQPFYRSSIAAGTQGFGLGLALAQRIAGLHKGRLYLSSSDISGTTFIITLPTASAKATKKDGAETQGKKKSP